MENDSSIKKTSIYLNHDLLRKLKRLAIDRGTSVNAIVLEAIEQEYADKPETSTAAAEPARSRHQALIDKLVYVLESDSRDAIDAVKTNIEVFFRLVKVDQKKSGRDHTISENPGEKNDKLAG